MSSYTPSAAYLAILAKTEVTFEEARQALADIQMLIEEIDKIQEAMAEAKAQSIQQAAAIALLQAQVAALTPPSGP